MFDSELLNGILGGTSILVVGLLAIKLTEWFLETPKHADNENKHS